MSIGFVIIACMACFAIGFIVAVPVSMRIHRAGSLVIDQTDPVTDKYSFELETGLSKLPEEDYISLKIKVVKDLQ